MMTYERQELVRMALEVPANAVATFTGLMLQAHPQLARSAQEAPMRKQHLRLLGALLSLLDTSGRLSHDTAKSLVSCMEKMAFRMQEAAGQQRPPLSMTKGPGNVVYLAGAPPASAKPPTHEGPSAA